MSEFTIEFVGSTYGSNKNSIVDLPKRSIEGDEMEKDV
jgi:hypothetical protein